MFHFSRYVIMQHIKADCADVDIPCPDAVSSKSPELSIADAKYRVSQNRFLQSLQKEDLLIQELQKKSQLLTKRIRDLRFENADLDKQLQKIGKSIPQNQSITTQRIEKVRCSWEVIKEALKLLDKEREVVDSIVKGHADQYVLDGTSVAISIPRPLLEKVEKEIHKLPVGNVYEEGKLNILTVIQLLIRAIKMLIDERGHTDKNTPKLDLQYFEGKTKLQNETFLGLKSLRLKLKHEDHISISQSIAEKQHEWDLKWKAYLGHAPFDLIKYPNSALDLLPAMSPLSFTPATEEAYKSSVFGQYPASIPELTKKNLQVDQCKGADKTSGCQDCSTVVTAERNIIFSNLAKESENRKTFEKGSNADTPTRTEHSDFQILKYTGRKGKPAEVGKKRQTNVMRTPSSVKREDLLKRAQEQLAEEVANVVVSESPQNAGGKGKDLDNLVDTLISDPFLTRKQIPRTPENLITEIRSSWKKAIQAEGSSNAESHHTEATKDIPQVAVPASGNQTDSSMACFMSLCMSDSAESPLLAMQSSDSLKQTVIGHNELSTHQGCALDNIFFKQGLTHVPECCVTDNPEVGPKAVNKYVSKQCYNLGNSTEASPYVGKNSSTCTTLSWDTSRMVGGTCTDSQEAIHFGILQETLPEELGSESLNSINDYESDEVRKENSQDSKGLPDYLTENEHKLDLYSIRERYKALQKTLFDNSSSRNQISRCRSDFSLHSVGLETSDVLSSSGKPYAFDAELVKAPTHTTLERRVPLSPQVPFSPVQAREKLDVQNQGDLCNKLKG
ncbi:HAUS augmin-like complex subunit 6 isoform X2 [Sceloporus undulatus]|nr:HAUS augmin-like complex subunit 6 isoform X2 [Sceloporus undulatus]